MCRGSDCRIGQGIELLVAIVAGSPFSYEEQYNRKSCGKSEE